MSIKANELRIGNWILLSGGVLLPNPHRIVSKDIVDIDLNILPDGCVIDPIPLTPDILEKAGFVITSKGFFTHPNWYNLSLKYRNGTYDLRCNFIDRVATNVDSLHQLQNLYFALTGEELIVKF